MRRAPVRQVAGIVWRGSIPLDELVPENARAVRLWRIPANLSAPAQLVVLWEWGKPGQDEIDPLGPPPAWGVGVWNKTTVSAPIGGPGLEWRLEYARRFSRNSSVFVQFGDVTRDGHKDVLIEDSMGSGACGHRRVVVTVGAAVREVLDVPGCENGVKLGIGSVLTDRPGQHCKGLNSGAHCFRTRILETRRWDGHALRPDERKVVRLRRDHTPM